MRLIGAVLLAAVAVCGLVAALLGHAAWAGVLGGGLVMVYWALEALTWRRARDRRDLALGTAIGGMFLRICVVLTVLVVVALVARPEAATAILAFALVFTVYLPLRMFTYSETHVSSGSERSPQ